MTLSHHEVVSRCEKQLIAALAGKDNETIIKLCHPNIVYTDEGGKAIIGVKSLHVLRPDMLVYDTIEVIQNDIHFFDSVAIVNSYEKRSGTYMGLPFSSEYNLTRVWKFGKRWRIICATAMMPC
jgi:hypothetical protein